MNGSQNKSCKRAPERCSGEAFGLWWPSSLSSKRCVSFVCLCGNTLTLTVWWVCVHLKCVCTVKWNVSRILFKRSFSLSSHTFNYWARDMSCFCVHVQCIIVRKHFTTTPLSFLERYIAIYSMMLFTVTLQQLIYVHLRYQYQSLKPPLSLSEA